MKPLQLYFPGSIFNLEVIGQRNNGGLILYRLQEEPSISIRHTEQKGQDDLLICLYSHVIRTLSHFSEFQLWYVANTVIS